MGISKKQIDDYFAQYYDDLVLYAKKLHSKHKVINESPHMFVSEAYAYVLDLKDEIPQDKLKHYIGTFLHNHSYWQNSKVREKERISKRFKTIEYQPSKYENQTEDEYEIKENEKINEYKAITQMYYNDLNSVFKKAIWEIYFIEECQKAQDFANYIGMSRTTAYKFINEMKEDINNYYKEYKANNNINKV